MLIAKVTVYNPQAYSCVVNTPWMACQKFSGRPDLSREPWYPHGSLDLSIFRVDVHFVAPGTRFLAVSQRVL